MTIGDAMRLVLLPGLDGTGLLFARLLGELGSRVDSTVVHYPADQALNYAEHENIARCFLPNDEPYVLLGESFSGPVAISIAASHPPLLAGLILCCSFARNPVTWCAHLKPLLGLVPFSFLPEAAQSFFIFGQFSTRLLRAEHRRAVSRVSNAALRARLRDIFEVNVTGELGQVEVPCMVLQASDDRVVPKVFSQLPDLPNAKRIEVKGPHLLLQAAPQKTSELILDFVRALPNR
jgi:pimeloyl-ACP methyl ester carboxylesterase